MSSLTPFSYVVLSLVGRRGATAGELAVMRDRGRMYWQASRSQWFAEPKRLAAAGLLTAEEEPGITGPRVRYRLTDAALEALAEWQRRPLDLPRIQHEGVVRVLASDLAGTDEGLRAALAHLRAELAAERANIAAAEEVAEGLPERRDRLLAQHRMVRRILAAIDDWAREVSP